MDHTNNTVAAEYTAVDMNTIRGYVIQYQSTVASASATDVHTYYIHINII